MIALLRKDLPWLVALGLGGLVTLSLVLCAEPFLELYVLPPTRLFAPFLAAWICGAVLGAFAGMHDELLGTREFLRHRPVSPRRLHGARVLGCAIVLACWLLLAPFVPFATEALFGRNVSLGTLDHLPELLATMLPAASAAAIALFAATLPLGRLLRLVVGAVAVLAVFPAIDLLAADPAPGREGLHVLPTYALLHAVCAVLFAAASFASAGTVHDPDRPLPARVRTVAAGLATAVFALFAASALAMLQYEAWRSLAREWPYVGSKDGTLQLVVRRGRNVWFPVDREHRVTGPQLQGGNDRGYELPLLVHVRGDLGFDAPRFHAAHGPWRLRARLYGDGLVRVVHGGYASLRSDAPLTVTVAGRPDGRPFDPGATLVATGDGEREPLCVVERGHGLWRFDGTSRQFVAVPLPDGDRLVDWRRVRPAAASRKEEIEIEDLLYRAVGEEADAFVGERGVYELRGSDLVPARPWVQAQATRHEERRDEPVLTMLDEDPLHPRARLVGGDGTILFEHDWAPRTFAERVDAANVLLCSGLRPPVLQVAVHLGLVDRPHSSLDDALLARGRRPWLVLLCVAFALACAFAAHRRLRRFGAPATVGRVWFVLTALLGPAALLASCVLERRRAHDAMPDAAAPPPLRIHTP